MRAWPFALLLGVTALLATPAFAEKPSDKKVRLIGVAAPDSVDSKVAPSFGFVPPNIKRPVHLTGNEVPHESDPTVQQTSPSGSAPLGGSIPGLGSDDNPFGLVPPDPTGDIGPNHYVQAVNVVWAVFDRNTGERLTKAAGQSALFAKVDPDCACAKFDAGDPIVLYDHLADRWFISQFNFENSSTPPYYQCMAVSKTGDPTGEYYLYEVLMPAEVGLNDYPKFGIWSDAYSMSVVQFTNRASRMSGAGIFAFPRAAMLDGTMTDFFYYNLGRVEPNIGVVLPADLDGPPPPAGAPIPWVAMDAKEFGAAQDGLHMYELRFNADHPTSSTFVQAGLPVLEPAPFDPQFRFRSGVEIAPNAAVDALGDRLMMNLQYRNFGAYETLAVNHTVDADGTDRAGVRWYELRRAAGEADFQIHDQGTFAPGTANRWMGSSAINGAGTYAVGYSIVDYPSLTPSLAVAWRTPSDPSGELVGEEIVAVSPDANYGGFRWGDYSQLSVDPLDDETFWYTGMLIQGNSWNTRIISIRAGAPRGTIEGTIRDADTSEPLKRAQIAANGSAGLSDEEGRYLIRPYDGVTSVTVTRRGYQSQTFAAVDVQADTTTTLDFALEPLPPAMLELYGVNSSGAPVPFLVELIPEDGGDIISEESTSGSLQLSLPAGNYDFDAFPTESGYQVYSDFVTLVSGETTSLTLTFATPPAITASLRFEGLDGDPVVEAGECFNVVLTLQNEGETGIIVECGVYPSSSDSIYLPLQTRFAYIAELASREFTFPGFVRPDAPCGDSTVVKPYLPGWTELPAVLTVGTVGDEFFSEAPVIAELGSEDPEASPTLRALVPFHVSSVAETSPSLLISFSAEASFGKFYDLYAEVRSPWGEAFNLTPNGPLFGERISFQCPVSGNGTSLYSKNSPALTAALANAAPEDLEGTWTLLLSTPNASELTIPCASLAFNPSSCSTMEACPLPEVAMVSAAAELSTYPVAGRVLGSASVESQGPILPKAPVTVGVFLEEDYLFGGDALGTFLAPFDGDTTTSVVALSFNLPPTIEGTKKFIVALLSREDANLSNNTASFTLDVLPPDPALASLDLDSTSVLAGGWVTGSYLVEDSGAFPTEFAFPGKVYFETQYDSAEPLLVLQSESIEFEDNATSTTVPLGFALPPHVAGRTGFVVAIDPVADENFENNTLRFEIDVAAADLAVESAGVDAAFYYTGETVRGSFTVSNRTGIAPTGPVTALIYDPLGFFDSPPLFTAPVSIDGNTTQTTATFAFVAPPYYSGPAPFEIILETASDIDRTNNSKTFEVDIQPIDLGITTIVNENVQSGRNAPMNVRVQYTSYGVIPYESGALVELVLAPPAGGSCETAPEIEPGIVYYGNTLNDETLDVVEGVCGSSEESSDVWYRYTPATSGRAEASLCGSGFDTVLSVHKACGEPTFACNDDACEDKGSKIAFDVQANESVLIRVSGYDWAAGAFQLLLDGPASASPAPVLSSTLIEEPILPGEVRDLFFAVTPDPSLIGYLTLAARIVPIVGKDTYLLDNSFSQDFYRFDPDLQVTGYSIDLMGDGVLSPGDCDTSIGLLIRSPQPNQEVTVWLYPDLGLAVPESITVLTNDEGTAVVDVPVVVSYFLPCGKKLRLGVDLYAEDAESTLMFTIPIGFEGEILANSSVRETYFFGTDGAAPQAAIPLWIEGLNQTNSVLTVSLSGYHFNPADASIRLIAPDGVTSATVVVDGSNALPGAIGAGCNPNDVRLEFSDLGSGVVEGVYDWPYAFTYESAESLADAFQALSAEDLNGTWTLLLQDRDPSFNGGFVFCAGLEFRAPPSCTPTECALIDIGVKDLSAPAVLPFDRTETCSVTLYNGGTATFSDPELYYQVQLLDGEGDPLHLLGSGLLSITLETSETLRLYASMLLPSGTVPPGVEGSLEFALFPSVLSGGDLLIANNYAEVPISVEGPVVTPSATPTPTTTPTPSATTTPTGSGTTTQTSTPTITPSPTFTGTFTMTVTATPSASDVPTTTVGTITPSATPLPTISVTATPSITLTPDTPTQSVTPSPTTPSLTETATPTPSASSTSTPSISPTTPQPTISVTATPSITFTPDTPTQSVTPSPSPTTPSLTQTATPSPSASVTPTQETPTQSVTPSATPSLTETATPTASASATATPTATATATVTLTPTATPTPSSTPTPTPVATFDWDDNTSESWTFGAPEPFDRGTSFSLVNGTIALTVASSSNAFGFVESPDLAAADAATTASVLYRARFRVTTNVAAADKVPSIRLRAFPTSYDQTAAFVVESEGAADISPSPAGRSYTQFFTLPGGARTFRYAFDVLNFIPNNAADGTLALDAVEIDVVQPGTPRLDHSYDFTNFAPTVFAERDALPMIARPFFSRSAAGLEIRGSANATESMFGYYGAEPAGAIFAAGRLYELRFTVGSDAVDFLKVPGFRLRLNDNAGRFGALLHVESQSPTAIVPILGTSRTYSVWAAAPTELTGSGMSLSFDYLFVPRPAGDATADDPATTLRVERIEVYSYPMP